MGCVTDHAALYDELLPRLREPQGRPPGPVQSFCPAHNDGAKHHRRSLTLSRDKGVTCWAGCDFKTILSAFGVELRAPDAHGSNGVVPFRARGAHPSTQDAPVAIYAYVTTDGERHLEKGRWESNGVKTFRWRFKGARDWSAGIAPVRMADVALWGVDLVERSPRTETVYICEGEKAAEACRARGLLAVTHGGGASTRDFGTALAILAGRPVALWPDNDQPGRDYLKALEAVVKPIAASVRLVRVPVPEKGDAFDYFAAGGTVDGLAKADAPAVEVLADDAVRLIVPTPLGDAEFTFREMEKGARDLSAEMTVRLLVPGAMAEPYVDRINLLSISAREATRRELEAVTGKAAGWAAVLPGALAKARTAYLSVDRSICAADIDAPGELEFIATDLVPDDGVTVWFGTGSAGKTMLSYRLALAIAHGAPFLGRTTKERKVLVIDYETGRGVFAYRLNRLAAGAGLEHDALGTIQYWDAAGIPLPDQVEALRRCIDQHNIGFLLLDHAAIACGGKPEESEVAMRFYRAASRLGLPMLALAHITGEGDRDPAQVRRPFGSIFWHNGARRTWFMQRTQEPDSDRIDVGLFCRKVNDGKKPSDFGVRLFFEGTSGPVRVTALSLAENAELTETRGTEWLIHARLTRPMTYKELEEETGIAYETIKQSISRHGGLFRQVGESAGGRGQVIRWERAPGRETVTETDTADEETVDALPFR